MFHSAKNRTSVIACAKFYANCGRREVKHIIVYTNASLFAQNSRHKRGGHLVKIAHTLLFVQKQLNNFKLAPNSKISIKKFPSKRLNK